jgi:hypothetical protein
MDVVYILLNCHPLVKSGKKSAQLQNNLITFAGWIHYFDFKKNEEGSWYPMDLPFLYTTEELVEEFFKDIKDGKVRIDE